MTEFVGYDGCYLLLLAQQSRFIVIENVRFPGKNMVMKNRSRAGAPKFVTVLTDGSYL